MINKTVKIIYPILLLTVSIILIMFSVKSINVSNIPLISTVFLILLVIDYFDLYGDENIYFNLGPKMILVFTQGWQTAAIVSALAMIISSTIRRKSLGSETILRFSKEYITAVLIGWLFLVSFGKSTAFSESLNMLIDASLFLIIGLFIESLFELLRKLINKDKIDSHLLVWTERYLFISMLSIIFSFASYFLWVHGNQFISNIFILFFILFVVIIYLQNKKYQQVQLSVNVMENINSILSEVKRKEDISGLNDLLSSNHVLNKMISGYYYFIKNKNRNYEGLQHFKQIELIPEIKSDILNNIGNIKRNIEKRYKNMMVIEIKKKYIKGVLCLETKYSNRGELPESINDYINDYFNYIFDNIQIKNKLEDDYAQTIEAIVNLIEAKNPTIKGHSNRVSYYCYEIGKLLGLSENEIEDLRISGYLHDIGMINVPEYIVRKPEALTTKEYEEIKKHPVTGYNLIKNIEYLKNVLPGILQHHERINGSGYPYGLSEDEISLQGKIIAVADTFDAMLSNRTYRAGLSVEFSLNFLKKKSGTLYDKHICDVFIKGITDKSIKIMRRDDDIVY